MVPINPLSGIDKIKRDFSLSERKDFFDLFNQCFQLEFMFFELSFVKSNRLFRYVDMTDKLLKDFFKKELGIDNYPKLSIELLVNRKMKWENILTLEKKHDIKVTSMHAPFDFREGDFMHRVCSRLFKHSLASSFADENVQYIIESSDVPLTVHAESLDTFLRSGLNKKTEFRIENDSIFSRYSQEDEDKFCSIESIKEMAKKHGSGIVFDSYHFYTYKTKLAKRKEKQERVNSLSDIIRKKVVLGDKFHLSEGKNGGKKYTDQHISLYNSKGSLRLKSFLEKYNFFVNPKSYMTLEINPLEKGARMVPKRVVKYYAQNFLFLIDCLAINLLKKRYPRSDN